MFLDKDLMQTFEAFYDTKASDDLVTYGWMFKKEFNFKSFDELDDDEDFDSWCLMSHGGV